MAERQGFTIPTSSQEARDKWKLETNQVAQFIIEECDERKEAAENFSDLYKCYKDWVERNHLTLLTTKTFSSRTQRLGFIGAKSGSDRKIKGLKLKGSCGI